MPEQTDQLSDAEQTIQAEVHTIQQERFDFEVAQRKTWTDGLIALDVKHRNAIARLNVARAERIKAAASAAAAAQDAKVAQPAPVAAEATPAAKTSAKTTAVANA